ncbi:uncharacterized protein IUM83_18442 [Phytophthora cinnamomi]|uniref:uncharacterized protein n=1 Tax=Phytophthora cinnamomi TaxID=4785 RepID=UPI002A2B2AA1|nr:hypothetical protein IUM83_03768 [Phytophthora cinnamomi]KAG6616476.1 hypothetical protein IUM83_18442 [Phytophthora cinnamomi]KAJ8575122.1 hypothetical protein ON010_g4093 [Phytophthora cinnamomi]
MDSSATCPDIFAPYDDGSSTESEPYDEELLQLAREAQNVEGDRNLAPNSTVDVKVEAFESVETVETVDIPTNSSATNLKAEDTAEPKATPTDGKCERCRRKLPEVTEQESADIQQGKLRTKRCACCEQHFPLNRFSKANRGCKRAIPRCKACVEASQRVWLKLRKSPEYAEAYAAEMEKKKAENKKKRPILSPWERKTTKQRYEEQFQLVGGKTARARRLAHRIEEKKKKLASILGKQQERKKE